MVNSLSSIKNAQLLIENKNMSYLDILLNGVEVEWKTLGEVGELVRGNGLPKTDFTEAGIPAIHYGQIYTHYKTFTTETKSFVSTETAKKLRKVNHGDVVITNTSEDLEGVGKAVVYLGKDQAVTGGHATIFKPSKQITGKYFAYFTQTEMFASQKKKYAKGTKVIDVSATDMAKITIPIPPLTVQTEIVRILDTFTELTAEITAELTARKMQSNYYREQLLSFDEGEVEWKTLGEVVEIKRGKRLIKSQLEETGKYAVFQNSMTPLGYFNESNVQADTTFIISAGSAGEIGYSIVDFWAADDVYYFVTPENLKNKFLYYFLLVQQVKIVGQVRRASVPRLSKTAFEKMLLPIPSIEEQARIVSILDKFDMLTTSISEGLPKEIELRKKQYEYYRDMLLNFNKLNIDDEKR